MLSFRQGYFSDPAAWNAFTDLLRDIFNLDVTAVARFGGPDPTCMPFGYIDPSGQCVANVSAFSMPLMVDGRMVSAKGIQSVAVRPDWRGKGLYRDLMTRALAWCDGQGCELVALYSDNPALYRPFGFQRVPEHCFVGVPRRPIASDKTVRRLSAADPDDLAVMQALLASRTPVSNLVAVADQRTMFLLNVTLDPSLEIAYLEEAQAVIVFQHSDACFRLIDIVAPAMPSLGTILAALGISPARVEICFPTDRLGWSGTPTPCDRDSLLVRGELPFALRQPFMLPPTALF
ncbi:MAG: GNAT family N-acetyltransferase [Dongiaceae bacterium]